MHIDRAPRLERFVADFSALMDRVGDDEPCLLAQGRDLLAGLVASDDWLPSAYTAAHPEHYQQYLLHCDPRKRFSVVSFVWGPGQRTPVHDHTVWGLVGMLRGAEYSERFEAGPAGQAMRPLGSSRLTPGAVEAVSPHVGDIHCVANAFDDRVSISIHVYGADIGRVARHVYDPATSTPTSFVSGYAQPSKHQQQHP